MVLNQTRLLTAGEVRPSLCKQLGIKQTVFFADIDWELLLCQWQTPRKYQAIPKFPPVTRDLSFVLDQSIHFDRIHKLIAQHGDPLISDVSVFDVYHEGVLGTGKKAYALRFTLQGKDRTLDDRTISQSMARLTRTFSKELGAVVRE